MLCSDPALEVSVAADRGSSTSCTTQPLWPVNTPAPAMTVLLLSSSDGEFWGDVCSECNIIHLQYFVMCCSFHCVRHVVYCLGGSGIAVPLRITASHDVRAHAGFVYLQHVLISCFSLTK